MIADVSHSQSDYYRGFLMRRGDFEPKDYGVNKTRPEFQDEMADDFAEAFKGTLTVDELLLHPRSALSFCDDVRKRRLYIDMPDDLILRSIINARKHG